MPAEDGPIGPANNRYKPGFSFLQEVLVEDETIQILSAPYFLATKFEAFHTRGGDYRTSYDFEDIVYVVDNRIGIVEDILNADQKVRLFLKEEFRKLTTSPYEEEIIRAQIHPFTVDERYPIVSEKINQMISSIR